jgi:tetratricopeptide (TPR) repeat protein
MKHLVIIFFVGAIISSCGEEEKPLTHIISGNAHFKTQEALDLNSEGISLVNSGDISGAQMKFEEGLVYEPNNATLLGNLGNCALSNQDNATAKSYFLQSIKADSNYLNSVVNYAGILYDEDNDSAAYWNRYIVSRSTDNAQLGVAHVRLAYDAFNHDSCMVARMQCDLATMYLTKANVDLTGVKKLESELANCK